MKSVLLRSVNCIQSHEKSGDEGIPFFSKEKLTELCIFSGCNLKRYFNF